MAMSTHFPPCADKAPLFDTRSYQYNTAALSCQQQVALYQQLCCLTAPWGGSGLASAAPPPLQPSYWPWVIPGAAAWSSAYGVMMAHAGCHWGAMASWPQMPPPGMMTPNAYASQLALHPLPAGALAALSLPAPSDTPSSTCQPLGSATAATAAAQGGTSSTANDKLFRAATAQLPGLLDSTGGCNDEEICDDLFRMFAEDLDIVPVAGHAVSATNQEAGEQGSSLVRAAVPNTAAMATTSAALPLPPPSHLAAAPTSSSTAAPGALLLPGSAHPFLAALQLPHLPPAPAPPPPPGYMPSTVFSAAHALPASRPATPAAAAAPHSTARACSMPTPTSSGAHASAGGGSGRPVASPTSSSGARKLGVHSGGVRKPSSPLRLPGRHSCSLAPAQALHEGELTAHTDSKSPPSGAATTASPVAGVVVDKEQEEELGRFSASAMPQVPAVATQAQEEPELLALDCDNLNHTLDWMDVLPNLA